MTHFDGLLHRDRSHEIEDEALVALEAGDDDPLANVRIYPSIASEVLSWGQENRVQKISRPEFRSRLNAS
ncbi:hypothetical protein NKI48_27930 [Mesorhizobium sp. M0644]|uniref:hypothetical protein n=1 Tax=Mesorhizobium sp. M0644 TaxID=2956979 RepID=UPI003337A8BA